MAPNWLLILIVILLVYYFVFKKRERDIDYYRIYQPLSDQEQRLLLARNGGEVERIVSPADLVNGEINRVRSRAENMTSPFYNGESPLQHALHGGAATDLMGLPGFGHP